MKAEHFTSRIPIAWLVILAAGGWYLFGGFMQQINREVQRNVTYDK